MQDLKNFQFFLAIHWEIMELALLTNIAFSHFLHYSKFGRLDLTAIVMYCIKVEVYHCEGNFRKNNELSI